MITAPAWRAPNTAARTNAWQPMRRPAGTPRNMTPLRTFMVRRTEGSDGDGGGSGSGGSPQPRRSGSGTSIAAKMLAAFTAVLVAFGLIACKRKKKGRAESTSSSRDEPPRMMPIEAYIIGRSKAVKLPIHGDLARWKIKHLREEAKNKADALRKDVVKDYRKQLRKAYADCRLRKASFGLEVINEDYKRIIDKDMSGTKRLHFEYWILWKDAYCKYSYPVGAVLHREMKTSSNPHYDSTAVRR